MKNIIRICFIIYLFIASIFTNAVSLSATAMNSTVYNSEIQSKNYSVSFYKQITNSEKTIAPAARNNILYIFSSKNKEINTGFGGLKGYSKIADTQFYLLLAYLYNKSYLTNKYNKQKLILLSEINPNAP